MNFSLSSNFQTQNRLSGTEKYVNSAYLIITSIILRGYIQ